jgi:hypothetical protein
MSSLPVNLLEPTELPAVAREITSEYSGKVHQCSRYSSLTSVVRRYSARLISPERELRGHFLVDGRRLDLQIQHQVQPGVGDRPTGVTPAPPRDVACLSLTASLSRH